MGYVPEPCRWGGWMYLALVYTSDNDFRFVQDSYGFDAARHLTRRQCVGFADGMQMNMVWMGEEENLFLI